MALYLFLSLGQTRNSIHISQHSLIHWQLRHDQSHKTLNSKFNTSQALLNVRSLTNKSFLINELISSHSLDFTLLTETWLDINGAATLIETVPLNFSFFHTTRNDRRGGGIAAVFSDIYGCKEVYLGNFISFEYLALSVHCKTTVLIVTVYCPPKSKCGFLEEFSQLLSEVSTDYDCLVISGDFNIHIDIETNPDTISFICRLEAFDLSHMSRTHPQQRTYS